MSVETAFARAEGFIEIHRPVDVPPIAVSLAARALALEAIMEYLNKVSATRGGRAQLALPGGGKLGQRYGRDKAEYVQEGAEIKAANLRDGFVRGIRTLAATEALKANGYDEDEIERERMIMQMAINKQFGVGNSNSEERAAAVARAQ